MMAPVAEEENVLRAVDSVARIVKTERLPLSVVRAENKVAAVQTPLSAIRLRRFQPRSTIGAHKKDKKKGNIAIAPTVATWCTGTRALLNRNGVVVLTKPLAVPYGRMVNAKNQGGGVRIALDWTA